MAIQLTPGDIDDQIEGVMVRDYVAVDYLSIFRQILRVQVETESVLRARDIYPSVSKSEVDNRLEQGLPVIEPGKLRLSEKALVDLLRKIVRIYAEYEVNEHSAAKQLLEAKESGRIKLNELILKILSNDSGYVDLTCIMIGMSAEDIKALGQLLAAPFLWVCAAGLEPKLDLERMRTNRCPVCSTAPAMAKLRKLDGKRVLECALCRTQWVFKRIGCPFCGNEDQRTLGFFFTSEEDAFRVDTCDKCNRFIKTVDERKNIYGTPSILSVEDAATLYLDLLAERQGFKSIVRS